MCFFVSKTLSRNSWMTKPPLFNSFLLSLLVSSQKIHTQLERWYVYVHIFINSSYDCYLNSFYYFHHRRHQHQPPFYVLAPNDESMYTVLALRNLSFSLSFFHRLWFKLFLLSWSKWHKWARNGPRRHFRTLLLCCYSLHPITSNVLHTYTLSLLFFSLSSSISFYLQVTFLRVAFFFVSVCLHSFLPKTEKNPTGAK